MRPSRPARSSRLVRLSVLLLAVLLIFGSVPAFGDAPDASSTSIDSCTTISTPGRYVLASDVRTETAESCIDVRADDVTLDGRGHVIDGRKTDGRSAGNSGNTGLSVRDAGNVTVRNLTATDWEVGVGFAGTTDGTVRNVRVVDNDLSGVRLADATGTDLTNVTATTNVNPQRRPFPGPSESAGIFVADSTDTRVLDADLSRNVAGFASVRSTGSVVVDSVGQSNEVGFLLGGTNGTVRGGVAAGNNVAFFADNASASTFARSFAISNRVGFGVENSTNATVADVNASSGLLGVSVVESRRTTLANATTTDELVGVNFLDSTDAAVTDSTVTGSGFVGVGLVGTSRARISNTTVARSAGSASIPGATSSGFYLNDSAARLRDVTAAKNENWTVFAERGSSLDARNVSFDGTRLSFAGRNVALDSTDRPEAPPNRAPVGRSFVVSGTSSDSTLDLRVGYDPRAVASADVDEATLRLWRYDGDWSRVADSLVVRDDSAVTATLSRTDRSVVTVLGERNATESTPSRYSDRYGIVASSSAE